jgi:hypothetical protein
MIDLSAREFRIIDEAHFDGDYIHASELLKRQQDACH